MILGDSWNSREGKLIQPQQKFAGDMGDRGAGIHGRILHEQNQESSKTRELATRAGGSGMLVGNHAGSILKSELVQGLRPRQKGS